MIENFKYNDIVLYAKGWLEHKGNTTCEDLAYLLGQMYGWSSTSDDELSLMMLCVFDCLIEEMQGKHWSGRWAADHFHFEQEVRRRMSIYECTRGHAIIYLVLAVLQGMPKNEIRLNRYVYGKGKYFRMGNTFGTNPISMTYTEMNRRAQKSFT